MSALPSAVNWGFIGCGNVTEHKSGPAFRQVPGSRVVAVMRRDAELAEDYARRHSIPRWYSSSDHLLSDPEVNAVYVATPPSTHMAYALDALAAGKPVYIEKPMAMSAEECQKILAAGERADLPVFVAYYRRALPRFTHIKRLLDDGAIGSVRCVRCTLYRPHNVQHESPSFWRIDPQIAGGGLFVDLGSHTLDLLDFLLGPIAAVHGLASSQLGRYAAEDSVSIAFQFQSGVQGIGQWNFCGFQRVDEIEIMGDQGALHFSTFGDEPVRLETKRGLETFQFTSPAAIQLPLIRQVVSQLQGRGQATSTGSSAARTTALMERALQSYKD